MKATGIVRRIDDLGRVVIPKEIRRVLKIREGDPLEIFVENDGEVIFKKYSQIAEIERSGALLCEAVQKFGGFATALCDKSEIRFIAGESKKDYVGKPLSAALLRAIEKRQGYIPADGEDLPLFDYGDAHRLRGTHRRRSAGRGQRRPSARGGGQKAAGRRRALSVQADGAVSAQKKDAFRIRERVLFPCTGYAGLSASGAVYALLRRTTAAPARAASATTAAAATPVSEVDGVEEAAEEEAAASEETAAVLLSSGSEDSAAELSASVDVSAEPSPPSADSPVA